MKIGKTISMSVIALLVVAMSAGMAAAIQVAIQPDPIPDLIPGQYVSTTAHLYSMYCDGSQRTLTISVVDGTPADITFRVTDNNVPGGSEGPTEGGIAYSYTPAAGTTTYDIKVEIMAATGTEGNSYTVHYKDVQSGSFDEGSATVRTTAIPEFATLAIPVVALLGLVLFMRRKKE